MPFSARTCLRSSADKSKRHGLSVEFSFGLQFLVASTSPIPVCRIDRLGPLCFGSWIDGFQRTQCVTLTLHHPPILGTHTSHDAQDMSRSIERLGSYSDRIWR